MSEITPIVNDLEMLRAYAETIRLKDSEIERLKALVNDRMHELQEINELKALLDRAADALYEEYGSSLPLIDELRKAAE